MCSSWRLILGLSGLSPKFELKVDLPLNFVSFVKFFIKASEYIYIFLDMFAMYSILTVIDVLDAFCSFDVVELKT